MRPKNALGWGMLILIGASMIVLVGLGLRRALSHSETTESPQGHELALRSDSCAFAEPDQDQVKGFCDSPEPSDACTYDGETRKRIRIELRQQVRISQVVWASTLQTSRIIDRLQSGDLVYSTSVGQRIFDATFKMMGSYPIPEAPADKSAFISALSCSPRTWANRITLKLNQLFDADLAKALADLPAPEQLKSNIEKGLAFLGPEPK